MKTMDAMTRTRFTQDWVSPHVPAWTHLFQLFDIAPNKMLEIGSFEGRSACWFLEHALSKNGTLYCVDTWKGNAEFKYLPKDSVTNAEARFHENTASVKSEGQQIVVIKDTSVRALSALIHAGHENSFDVIYIDGSHMAADVLTDACLAWALLGPQGVLIFDDYLFRLELGLEDRPKLAIDMFTALFNSQLTTVMSGDQYIVSKKPIGDVNYVR